MTSEPRLNSLESSKFLSGITKRTDSQEIELICQWLQLEFTSIQIHVKHKIFLHKDDACCSVVMYVNRVGITYEQEHKMALRFFEAQ